VRDKDKNKGRPVPLPNHDALDKAKRLLDRKTLQAELVLLGKMRRLFATDDGRDVLLHIVRKTQPIADTFDNSGKTAYMLGEQGVGKMIMGLITSSGHTISMTDVSNSIDINRIDNINNEINRLLQEDKKCQT
jgi:hypothetical protein